MIEPPEQKQAWNRRKAAARKYQPGRIRLLVIDRAPPEAPADYFYFEDGEDALYRDVCEVLFEEQPHGHKPSYLKLLRRRGVFVVELKPNAPWNERDRPADYVPWLVLVCEPLAPEHVMIVGEFHEAARRELQKAGLAVIPVKLPLPGPGRESDFRRLFRAALVKADLESLIKPAPAKK